jgi:hypothetical protein
VPLRALVSESDLELELPAPGARSLRPAQTLRRSSVRRRQLQSQEPDRATCAKQAGSIGKRDREWGSLRGAHDTTEEEGKAECERHQSRFDVDVCRSCERFARIEMHEGGFVVLCRSEDEDFDVDE